MKRWFLWNFTMLNTHAEILWISSILEYLELEINILFQWALVSSTRIFTGQLIRSMRIRFKISCQRAQNTIFSFAKYTRPWLLGNQIKSNSCDFNWGEGDLDKYQLRKILWLCRGNNELYVSTTITWWNINETNSLALFFSEDFWSTTWSPYWLWVTEKIIHTL